jgi:hypothetical protein
VVEGGFDHGVQGIVFVLGDNIDPAIAKKLILPLENAVINQQSGTAANVMLGTKDANTATFEGSGLLLVSNIESVPAQVEFISYLAKNIELQSERFNPATDMPEAVPPPEK